MFYLVIDILAIGGQNFRTNELFIDSYFYKNVVERGDVIHKISSRFPHIKSKELI